MRARSESLARPEQARAAVGRLSLAVVLGKNRADFRLACNSREAQPIKALGGTVRPTDRRRKLLVRTWIRACNEQPSGVFH